MYSAYNISIGVYPYRHPFGRPATEIPLRGAEKWNKNTRNVFYFRLRHLMYVWLGLFLLLLLFIRLSRSVCVGRLFFSYCCCCCWMVDLCCFDLTLSPLAAGCPQRATGSVAQVRRKIASRSKEWGCGRSRLGTTTSRFPVCRVWSDEMGSRAAAAATVSADVVVFSLDWSTFNWLTAAIRCCCCCFFLSECASADEWMSVAGWVVFEMSGDRSKGLRARVRLNLQINLGAIE